MRKAIVLCVAMLFAGAAFADTIIPKIGYDFASQQKFTGPGLDQKFDTDPGITIGADYIHPINDMFGIGGGFEYQLARKLKPVNATTDPQFNFLPIYVTGVITPFKECCKTGFKPYGKLNLGYDMLMGNDAYKSTGSLKGGFYWALGIGTSYKNFIGELTYSTYAGQNELTAATVDITYSKLALNFGYQFDLNLK